ncbi:hypothetical protein [Micromonospora sp. DT227]|uniref:hypothetical protein n=1 Tax=Micromonospora sp. DT227 TaxID=3393433 RepID=UPI003CE923EC
MRTISLHAVDGRPTARDVQDVRSFACRWTAAGNTIPSPDAPRGDPEWKRFLESWWMEVARFDAQEWHNALVPLVDAEEKARSRAQRAIDKAGARWSALDTAWAWHAAHHQYARAFHTARGLVLLWLAAAEARASAQASPPQRLSADAQALYEREVPEAERIPALDVDRARDTLHHLDTTHQTNKAIAAETLLLPAVHASQQPAVAQPAPAGVRTVG